jgi:hypothetical protein
MIEGSGSVPLTNGSGSRRPKNRRIRIHWGDGIYRKAVIMSERDDRSSYSMPTVTFDARNARLAFPEPEFVNLFMSLGIDS